MKEILRNLTKYFASLYFKSCSKKCDFSRYIPASGKVLSEKELKNMIDSSLDMWLTGGRFNEEFEKKFKEFLNVEYALTVNSGSSSNLLAVAALTSPKLEDRRLRRGDEVITVAASFPTTVNPILQNGLVPVLVDIESKTFNIDTSKIEEAVTPKTKAIIAAHTLGEPFDIEKIKEIAKRYNLWVIEDSCDALGAEAGGKKCGTIADIGTFSFYPAHHITMGEGGAVVTNNQKLYKILKSMRDWGRDCYCAPGKDDTCKKRFAMQSGDLPFGYDHKYTYSHFGWNLKITDWQASIGLAQLEKLPGFIKIRKENMKYLLEKLSDLKEYLIMPDFNEMASPFGFLVSTKNGFEESNSLIKFLEQNGIGTRRLFSGNILRHPMFVESDFDFRIGNSPLMNFKDSKDLIEKEIIEKLPQTEFVLNNSFWVGIWHGLSKSELDKISHVLHCYYADSGTERN